MTDRSEETQSTTSADEQTRERPRPRPLTDEELEDLANQARPGAIYSEAAWDKKARESLRRIERAIDELEAPDHSPRAVARKRRAREGELPAGLRSRITDHLGPVAYVQLTYSTHEHHVCHVGLRDDGSIEDAIVLVGPQRVRRFEDVREAIDRLIGPPGSTTATDQAPEQIELEEAAEGPDPFGRVYPIEAIEGIGDTYMERIHDEGIHATRGLWNADADQLAERVGRSPKVVQHWQRMAELMAISGIGPQYAELLSRAGVEGIDALASADPDELVSDIRSKQDEIDVRIQGNIVKRARAERWIEAARAHPWPEEDPSATLASSIETGTQPDQAAPFGDVHPVEDVEGIGETYGPQLAEIGIEDTRDLWNADVDRIAEALDASPKTVTRWQQMAELIAIDGIGPQYAELLARSGIHSVDELARADAEELVEAIETKQKDLLVKIQGNVIRTDRVQGWIDSAQAHDPSGQA